MRFHAQLVEQYKPPSHGLMMRPEDIILVYGEPVGIVVHVSHRGWVTLEWIQRFTGEKVKFHETKFDPMPKRIALSAIDRQHWNLMSYDIMGAPRR